MQLLQLIQLYFYMYEKELQWHYKRYTKKPKEPLFTDQEVLTAYLFAIAFEQVNLLFHLSQ